jgi:hybrid cluster-associated redox disulfide protein
MEITKDMLVGEVIREKPESVDILLRFGLGCIGCPASQMESIEEAAMVHGLDINELLKALNA